MKFRLKAAVEVVLLSLSMFLTGGLVFVNLQMTGGFNPEYNAAMWKVPLFVALACSNVAIILAMLEQNRS
jgi:hypothetical protein